jgi:RIO kinase 1
MGRRSAFGRDTEEDAWKSAEVDGMYKLHAADVRVPTPLLYFEGVLLMDLVLDADGVTARRLIDTTLSPDQANAAYHDMLRQLVRMLSCDLIHGDLSPYNVLWGADGATIIDFPQIVSAAQNSNSERFFLRDAENILGYFRAADPRLNARRGDAAEIWRAYLRRELTSDFVPSGRSHLPPPQRPLPIGLSPHRGASQPHQPQRGGRPPQHQHRDARPSQAQHQHRDARPSQAQPQRDARSSQAQPHRGGRPPQTSQQRDGRPNQSQRDGRPPQQQRDGRPPQQQRDGRPPQQQRGGRPPQRANGGAPQPQRNGGRPSGHGAARRPAPEVIVRPRANSGVPVRAPAELVDVAAKPGLKRG